MSLKIKLKSFTKNYSRLSVNKKAVKVGLICSRGGHLYQLYSLRKWWGKYDRFWITGKGKDSKYLLQKERIYYGYFPEHRDIFNAFRNFFLGLRIIWLEKPDLI
ncbi:MAG: hypothetical protein Q7S03_03970 [bacterium]|nr:hypothetical protein [bacterium]